MLGKYIRSVHDFEVAIIFSPLHSSNDVIFLQITMRFDKEMTPLVGKYLGACLSGLKDRNNIVRKYNASAIGHLMGIAKVRHIEYAANTLK